MNKTDSGLSNTFALTTKLKRSGLIKFVTRFVSYKFLKHYLYPTVAGRNAKPYDMGRFFESWYRSHLPQEFSDGITISPEYDPLAARFHYNATENSIVRHFARHPAPKDAAVLDVGSGAGHWVDFYRAVLGAARVTAVEISESCAAALREKYDGDPAVRVLAQDVADPACDLGEKYDLINAIGVMFHIVDDEAWRSCLRNFARHLRPGGRVVVGGQFGWITRDVQFQGADEFDSWDELLAAQGSRPLTSKRVRSKRYWKRTARACGLRYETVVRTHEVSSIYTPENHVLILSRAGDS